VLKRFLKCEDGATAIEYGLIAALIALGLISGFGSMADALSALWGDNNGSIQTGLNKNG
jgi:pilus assembly protein Flp/PilA